MGFSRRRWWVAATARVGGLALALGLLGIAAAEARSVTVRGQEADRYGRILLEFDRATKVGVRNSGSILVLQFSEPVTMRAEKLAAELPSYISIARRDPDGSGLRVALVRPMRINILQAGEKTFVDLLPENWTGLPPGLPADVVETLARRAEAAEAKLRRESKGRLAGEPRKVKVRVAQLPTLLRLAFELPPGTPARLAGEGGDLRVSFEGPFVLDDAEARGRLAPAIRAMTAEPSPGGLAVKLALQPGYEARGFREEESFVVDIAPVKPARVASPAENTKAEQAEPAEKAATAPAVPNPTPSQPLERQPAPKPASPPKAEAGRGASSRPIEEAHPSGPVRPMVSTDANGLRIAFPFRSRTAAAAFERDGVLTAVFHTPDRVDTPALPSGAEAFARTAEIRREGAVVVARFALAGPHLVRLAPKETGWVLTFGEKGLVPSLPLAPVRSVDESGRTILALPLPDASGVHWLGDPNGLERIAVATAFGPPRGLANLRRFVEFRLLPSAHGVAIVAETDDLVVRTGPEGVTIGRGSGLAVSPTGPAGGVAGGPTSPEAAIQRERWTHHQAGDVLVRTRELMQAVAQSPRSGQSAARLELARFLVANRLNHEAGGVLAFAVQEDAALARQRPVVLLQAVVAARTHRDSDARRLLTGTGIAEDPEAILWRAVLDGRQGQRSQALAGFRRSPGLIEGYPDDVQGEIRILAIQAALETGDPGYAESELATAGQLALGVLAGETLQLLRARLDEASGRGEVAVETYRQLAEKGERPVAAEATLRWMSRALGDGSLPAEEAIARLEALSMTWRGDAIEVAAIAKLGRLYAESGRWRDAFTMARRANRMFPDHEMTRTLHDDTARLFEGLFLSGKAQSLPRVDALALYFDFKEFTPIGRRGDEIVRRLADRLVELDLLDAAADLLQHQVDKRLTGAARSTVAARLATVHLMNAKPQQALAAIQATRLPELPLSIKRARALLEARALSDLSRTDLALEAIAGETGPEIDRLRADIVWTGRRWREAGEAHEALVGARWRGSEPLSDPDRRDVMRAAIAYSLGDETLALDRLRARFSPKMADSQDARTFGFLTQPNVASTTAFRELARGVTSADTLADFLKEYRKRYPDASAAERPGRDAGAPATEPSSTPQAQRSNAAPPG